MSWASKIDDRKSRRPQFVVPALSVLGVVATMFAAENLAADFDPMPHHSATAMAARRGECVNRALERIEGMALTVKRDRERLRVVVAANFTNGHKSLPTGSYRIARR